MTERTGTQPLPPQEAITILSLRLLIARAGGTDSLGWWEDESFTPHASFVLERLFPIDPSLTARSLALRAAAARHRAACADLSGALHLYRLDADARDRLALRFASLEPVPCPEGPITAMEVLRAHLSKLTGRPATYRVLRRTLSHGLQVDIPPAPAGSSPMVWRASALAWAYLEGRPGQPVFPFYVEHVP
jgi:hypothetical protein